MGLGPAIEGELILEGGPLREDRSYLSCSCITRLFMMYVYYPAIHLNRPTCATDAIPEPACVTSPESRTWTLNQDPDLDPGNRNLGSFYVEASGL